MTLTKYYIKFVILKANHFLNYYDIIFHLFLKILFDFISYLLNFWNDIIYVDWHFCLIKKDSKFILSDKIQIV